MSSMPIHLRPFRPDDLEAVITILIDTITTTWKPQLSATALAVFDPETDASKYVRQCGPEFRLALRDEEIVGMVHHQDNFINALHVPSAQQRRGIGHALMDHAETEISRKHKTARLETDTFNTQSQNFYLQRGYIEIDRYPDEEWNSGLTTILFEKNL